MRRRRTDVWTYLPRYASVAPSGQMGTWRSCPSAASQAYAAGCVQAAQWPGLYRANQTAAFNRGQFASSEAGSLVGPRPTAREDLGVHGYVGYLIDSYFWL